MAQGTLDRSASGEYQGTSVCRLSYRSRSNLKVWARDAVCVRERVAARNTTKSADRRITINTDLSTTLFPTARRTWNHATVWGYPGYSRMSPPAPVRGGTVHVVPKRVQKRLRLSLFGDSFPTTRRLPPTAPSPSRGPEGKSAPIRCLRHKPLVTKTIVVNIES